MRSEICVESKIATELNCIINLIFQHPVDESTVSKDHNVATCAPSFVMVECVFL